MQNKKYVYILFVNRVLGSKQTHLKTLERILIVQKITIYKEDNYLEFTHNLDLIFHLYN